jgi:glycerophosphoryl diester phosphodiesterase
VAELTFDEIRALDAGGGERVPTFDEVLAVIGGRIKLLCELKGPGVEEQAVAAVRAAGLVEEVTFTSFQFDRLARVRALEPAANLGGILVKPEVEAFDRLVELGAWAVGIHWRNLTADGVAAAQAKGLKVRGWNPDTEEDIRATLAFGVDGVSSNYPDKLLAVIRG